ncbi:Phosphoribosylformylglycinamidine synthase subunit PurQ [uncultured archaeon]|nr:Phosphoribosylformylglycinamidine synthase subunit PurQ [uncultured archaeon]
MVMKAIVLRAPGTNCDYETMFALRSAGFAPENVHINELINGRKKLGNYRLLALPGGFASGDYLGSGKVFANKLLFKLKDEAPEFIKSGSLVIGICNGFQVLVKAGILPGFRNNYSEQLTTLTLNNPSGFQCRWVRLLKQNSKCVFTSEGLETLNVPIAHGEGQFVPANSEVLQKLYANRQVVFKYEKNPNGSTDSIAGICDETGRVFGLMPHPERNLFGINAPNSAYGKIAEEGEGLQVFRNGYGYLKR